MADETFEVMERPSAGVIQEITSAEMDRQIATAKAYPRDIKVARKNALELATLSEDIALDCMYALPRKEDGVIKMIEGPSVRFAEILVHAWGNLRAGARVIEEGAVFVTAQGVCADLERNTAISFEVKRRITGKHGRFSADMIGVISNAASSIALRNAVFKVIPKALYWGVYQQARQFALGDTSTLASRRDKLVEFFVKSGADEKQIWPALGLASKHDFDFDHLAMLIGLRAAVKEGEIAPDRVFDPRAAEERKTLLLSDEAGEEFGTIDKQVAGKAKPAAKEKAASPKAGGEAEGMGGVAAEGRESGDQGQSDTPAGDAGSKEEGPTDEEIVAGVEAELKKAKTGKREIIIAQKGALSRIEATSEDEKLKARAASLLNRYELD